MPVPSCVVAIDRHEGEPSLHRADRLADGLATTVGPPEAYTGTLTIVGVDVGFTTSSAIVWGVFTDTNRFAGMLTGTYVGATAQATAVAGVGANALVGGSNHSVSLQPLSVQGQVGLNAAGGIGALELHYAQ